MKGILKKKTARIIGLFLVFGLAYMLLAPKGQTIDKLTSENVESLCDRLSDVKCQMARGICFSGCTMTIGTFSIVTNDSEHVNP